MLGTEVGKTALSAQCAHWAPPPQGEARGTWGTDCHVGAMPLPAMTVGAAVVVVIAGG